MEFKEAVGWLSRTVTYADVAKELGVSVQTVRQACMRPGTSGHRPPPKEWQKTFIVLSEKRICSYQRLINNIRQNSGPP